jgi:hypothetical protein
MTALLFTVGSVLFVITTCAVLLLGYFRFQELYVGDRDESPVVVIEEDGVEVYAAGSASGE